jgi:integrase
MGRKRKGSAYEREDGVILLAVQMRPGVKPARWTRPCRDVAPPPDGIPLTLEYARAAARQFQSLYDSGQWDPMAPAKPETELELLDAYAERWRQDREARGLRAVRDDRSRYVHWISPVLGHRPAALITVDEVETLRDELDQHVQSGSIAWKTAHNVWNVVTKLFSDMCRIKNRSLRIRKDNPASGVEPPDRGDRRAKTYLYPSEFIRFYQCEAVDLELRWIVAVDVYSYLRIGELAALECSDIDLDHDTINLHRAMDRKTGEVRKPKSAAGVRKVPIEPSLKPLLVHLVTLRGGSGRLFPVIPAERDLSKMLRAGLTKAGVTREAIFVTDATRKNLTAHDLRATGITWCAVRGDDAVKIMRRAGHEEMETTMQYVREAENLQRGFGEPFPPLAVPTVRDSATNSATLTPAPTAFTASGMRKTVVPAAGVELSHRETDQNSSEHSTTVSRTGRQTETPENGPRSDSATRVALFSGSDPTAETSPYEWLAHWELREIEHDLAVEINSNGGTA